MSTVPEEQHQLCKPWTPVTETDSPIYKTIKRQPTTYRPSRNLTHKKILRKELQI